MKIDFLILAAGLATRLSEIVEKGEKHLLPLSNGEPIIVRTLKVLNNLFEINNVYMVVRPDQLSLYNLVLEKTLKRHFNIEFIINNKYNKFNNSYSLYLGLKKIINNKFNDIIIMNGDIVILDIIDSNYNNLIFLLDEITGLISFRSENKYMRAYLDRNLNYIKYIGFDIPSHVKYANFLGLYIPASRLDLFYRNYSKIGATFDFITWYESIINTMIASNIIKLKAVPLFDLFYWDEVDDIEDLIRVCLKDMYLNNIVATKGDKSGRTRH